MRCLETTVLVEPAAVTDKEGLQMPREEERGPSLT
jgi:hypothetical protein